MIKTTQSVRFAIWLMILLNLLMSYACIWIFMRLAPVSGESNSRNLRSLESCEAMLTALATNDEKAFETAFQSARNNITEHEETPLLERIPTKLPAVFNGDDSARSEVIKEILLLSQVNRNAMENAAHQVSRFGMAGAWSVVFMALAMLLAGLIFKNRLLKGIVMPLQEIGDVISAKRRGDNMRRCSGSGSSGDIQRIYTELNDILDQSMPHPFPEEK